MKSRISKRFEEIKKKGERAFISYITAGDPSLDITYNLVLDMEEAGVDIVELGIPYSDPLADGPIIQRASQRALKAGADIESVFNLVGRLRARTQIPLVLLAYFNCVYKYGFSRFLQECRSKGVDGLIIPDLPLEERQDFFQLTRDYNIDLIPLVAPTSQERVKEIVKGGRGFVYCITSLGVTGKREDFRLNLNEFLGQVRQYTDLPLALGFGISSPEMVKRLRGLADGLIVGSGIIEEIERGIEDGRIEKRVIDFIVKLLEAQNIA